MSGVKAHGSTVEVRQKLLDWSVGEDGRILSVEVKFVDTGRNTGGEGDHLDHN